ncbi:unnamed protein product [Linum trigynum]|uniref:Uncharacterized protein n=1 Tax=Linum trigynum TaxID=586398 RepID=A0AAV2F934_9ROSI
MILLTTLKSATLADDMPSVLTVGTKIALFAMFLDVPFLIEEDIGHLKCWSATLESETVDNVSRMVINRVAFSYEDDFASSRLYVKLLLRLKTIFLLDQPSDAPSNLRSLRLSKLERTYSNSGLSFIKKRWRRDWLRSARTSSNTTTYRILANRRYSSVLMWTEAL